MNTWLKRWSGSMLIAHAGLELGSISATDNSRLGFQKSIFAMKSLHRLHSCVDPSR